MTPAELAKIFPLGPDSLPQPGVPQGRVEKCHFNSSRIFPGTVRDYWVYAPAQYQPTKAACVLVVQDGHDHLFSGRWNVAVVLDNLIHQKAMPVTIGVFINPGKIPATKEGGQSRDNRSFEYDTPGDRYARFVLEEILPEVAARYRLRTDGNSRVIMGGSSGGMCAFNAAWARPDAFQRVVSMVGSFTPMRGGHTFAAEVRLTEAKPLKVFLQGGAQDLDVANGNWWTANLEMLSALRFAGYDVQHVWDERAGHNEFHCSMICPDALRWVWRDYPKKIQVGGGSHQPVAQILAPQKNWRPVSGLDGKVGAIATDAKGRLYFADGPARAICRLDANDRVKVIARQIDEVEAMAVGLGGQIYVAQPKQRRVLCITGGKATVHCAGVAVTGITVAADGSIFLAEPARNRVMKVSVDGAIHASTRTIKSPASVRLSADGSQLVIGPRQGDAVWLANITPEGRLANVEPYHYLSREVGAGHRRIHDLAMTRPGWIITAMDSGLHLNNQNGLPSGFIPAPGGAAATQVALGGARCDLLYVNAGGRLYRRRIKLIPTLWL